MSDFVNNLREGARMYNEDPALGSTYRLAKSTGATHGFASESLNFAADMLEATHWLIDKVKSWFD